MTRTRSLKSVPADRAKDRLIKAQAFRETAELTLGYIDHLTDAAPITSNAVLAVIGFTDAITIICQSQVSQDDHTAAIKLLRDCLGNALPNKQEANLQKLLSIKTEVQYGARRSRADEANMAIKLMNEFAEWAISILRDRGVRLVD